MNKLQLYANKMVYMYNHSDILWLPAWWALWLPWWPPAGCNNALMYLLIVTMNFCYCFIVAFYWKYNLLLLLIMIWQISLIGISFEHTIIRTHTFESCAMCLVFNRRADEKGHFLIIIYAILYPCFLRVFFCLVSFDKKRNTTPMRNNSHIYPTP